MAATMFMSFLSRHSHCESSPGSSNDHEYNTSDGRAAVDLWTKLICLSHRIRLNTAAHSSLPFITTQPETWYSIYHPTEPDRMWGKGESTRMSGYVPKWITCRGRQSSIRVVTGPGVEWPCWSKIMRYHFTPSPRDRFSVHRMNE